MSTSHRSLLLTFRQATARRAQAEAEAEARRKTASDSSDTALAQARQSANSQLAEARKASETGQSILTQANLKHLWEQASVTPPTPSAGVDLLEKLERNASLAIETLKRIEASIEARKRWLDEATDRRIMIVVKALLALFILSVVGTALFYVVRDAMR